MHSGRIALLERLRDAEAELLAAIGEVEGIGPAKYSNVFDRQVGVIAEAMGVVYRRAMLIDGDYLTP